MITNILLGCILIVLMFIGVMIYAIGEKIGEHGEKKTKA